MHGIKVFVLALLVFLCVDYLWLAIIAKPLYIEGYGRLLRLNAEGQVQLALWAALLTYGLLVLGIVCFVLPKALLWWHALLWGALFGCMTYGIYDFTCLAVMADWPLKISLIDVAWGTFICALVSVCAYGFDHCLS
jgi:uncharacterized membrane protein